MPAALLRRRKPHTIKSPRRLVLRRARALWDSHPSNQKPRQFLRTDPDGNPLPDPDPEKLLPGHEQLSSYYKPSLTANESSNPNIISVTQLITTNDKLQTLSLASQQPFFVVAPRYSLPAGVVHSTYPPQGHGDEVPIVPHILFNDPHLPWERKVTKVKPDGRNLVPWLALLVFTQDELKLSAEQLAGPAKIFPRNVTQSTTLTVNMSISEVFQMQQKGSVITPVLNDGDSAVVTDFIFVPTKLFQSHVTTFNSDGTPSAQQTHPDVQGYKYISHVRAVHTDGMADAGIEDEVGLFSVVVAHRTGPWTITSSTPVVVHLVSLEGVEQNLGTWPLSGGDYVALCSLYSWTYQCLPPKSLDISDALEQLGGGLDVLRVPKDIYSPLLKDNPINQRVGQRLQDGYTLTKYRLHTGEETVAFYRGPFTPTNVVYNPKSRAGDDDDDDDGTDYFMSVQSIFSTDLQIMDKAVGIMDITYSMAWQLGKTLATADQAFTGALSRLRTSIHSQALQKSKATALQGQYRSSEQVIRSLSERFLQLKELPVNDLHDAPSMPAPHRRWRRERDKLPLDLSFWSPVVREHFPQEAIRAAEALAQSTTEGVLFNEHNQPVSSDWPIVLDWVLNRMSLVGVPAHYFIPDPAHLPRESLRFFSIDRVWIDALIDGALSLANHLEQDDDTIRTAIKSAINKYLDTVDPIIGYKPQIPTFGFLLRSEVVEKFPDLIVEAPRPDADKRAPLLRHENITTGVMLVLLDRQPGDQPSDLTKLTFTQPPHQQRFVAAAAVGPQPEHKPPELDPILELRYKRIFTKPDTLPADRQGECGNPQTWTRGKITDPPIQVFDFDSRLLRLENFAKQIFCNLWANMPKGDFTDTAATAAMCGLQLTDPMYQLEIDFNTQQIKKKFDVLQSSHTIGTTLNMLNRRDRSQMVEKYQAQQKTVELLESAFESCPSVPIMQSDVTHWSQVQHLRRKPHPAPHSRRVHQSPRQQISLQRSPPIEGAANKPIFTYTAYPLNAPQRGSPVPTLTGIDQDLIFSVILPEEQRNVGDFRLQELRLIIPVGPQENSMGRTNLTLDYTGPGLSMLSNLRFNVQAHYGKDETGQKVLQLRLLPRSTSAYIPIQQIAEASFLWSLVEINPYTESDLFVVCNVEEHYQGHPRPYYTSFQIPLNPTTSLFK